MSPTDPAFAAAGVTVTVAGDIATFTWGDDPKHPHVVTAQAVAGEIVFVPQRSGLHRQLMGLVGLGAP